MRRHDPYALPERIGRSIEASAPAGAGDLRRIADAWVEVVGPALAAHAMPARRRRDGGLVIHVTDASWQQAVELERRRLTTLLRERLGDETITEFRVEIGPVAARPADGAADGAPDAVATPPRPPGPRARALTAGVQDERLRAALAAVIEHTSKGAESRS